MKRLVVACAAVCVGLAASAVPAADRIYTPPPKGTNVAAVAAPRDDWFATVQGKFDRYGNRHADVVFDGDSITNRWETTGKGVWTAKFAARSADFGIEGDRVENVLWRLAKGQVEGVDPKVVVLMIGPTNTGRDTAGQIAEGITAVVHEYLARCPGAHVILMAVFPRSARPTDPVRVKVNGINTSIAALAANDRVSFIDIGRQLEESDGTISPSMMPDYLHPTAEGYRIWAAAIQPVLDKYLGH